MLSVRSFLSSRYMYLSGSLSDRGILNIPDAFSEATVAELIPDDYKENPEYAMFRFPYYLEMLFEKDRASFIQLCKEYK